MKTILCATDYSKNSVSALKYAYSLSTSMKAELKVIHVFDYPIVLDDYSLNTELSLKIIEENSIKMQNSELVLFCEKHLGTGLDKMNVSTEAFEGISVANAIISKANDIDAQLIITGMKGQNILRKIILGSTTKHLIEKSRYPVFAIPEDVTYNGIKTIVYATDLEEEDLGAIHKLTEIATPFNATIKIVHIAPLEETIEMERKEIIKEKINKYISYPNLQLDIFASNDVYSDLKAYVEKVNADVIALLEREDKSLTSSLFHRDLVKKMKSYGKIPLLSFNEKSYGMFHL